MHQIHCAENSDLASLAAAYCFGIAKNHPFVDGNKRAAFHSLLLFLDNNGCELTAGMAECIQIVLGTAAGEVSEPELAVWIRQNLNEID